MLIGEVERFKDVRERSVFSTDSADRGFEVKEALLLDGGCDLSSESSCDLFFMGDYQSTCFLDT
jgi:hypothetical protein